MQGPTIQGLMSSYLGTEAPTPSYDMQQQLQKQARSIFGNFPSDNFGGASGRQQAGSAQPPNRQLQINRRRKPAEAQFIVKRRGVDDPAPFFIHSTPMTAAGPASPPL